MDSDLTTAGGLATLGSLLVLTTSIIVPLRFYARRMQNASLKMDDWMSATSYVSSFSNTNIPSRCSFDDADE